MKHPAEICAEIENSLPLYVGGDLESEAIAATDAHLVECSRCAQRAKEAREAHGLLVSALKLTSTRGPDLWAGVRAVLVDEGLIHGARVERAATVAPIAAPVQRIERAQPRSIGRRWMAWSTAVAAAVLFGFWLGSRMLTDDAQDKLRTDPGLRANPIADVPHLPPIQVQPVSGPGLRRLGSDEVPLRVGAEIFVDSTVQDRPLYDANMGAPAGLRQVRPNQ
jgi:anti-sigma factor RsiW